MTECFHTIDRKTLMNQLLSPIRFKVEELLPHGLPMSFYIHISYKTRVI